MDSSHLIEQLEAEAARARHKWQEQRRQIMESLSKANIRVGQQADQISYLTSEVTRLGKQAEVAARATAERDKAKEKAKAAESARVDAKRAAEPERLARLRAEETRDRLVAALRAAKEQPSRIDPVLVEHEAD